MSGNLRMVIISLRDTLHSVRRVQRCKRVYLHWLSMTRFSLEIGKELFNDISRYWGTGDAK